MMINILLEFQTVKIKINLIGKIRNSIGNSVKIIILADIKMKVVH